MPLKTDKFSARNRVEPDSIARNGEKFAQFGGFWGRLFAFVIDTIISFIANFAFMVSLMLVFLNLSIGPWMFLILLLLISSLYWTVSVLTLKGTIGMRIFGLRVLRVNGSRCGFWQANARFYICYLPFASLLVGQHTSLAFFIFLPAIAFIINSLFIVIRKDKRGLNDLICGTIVIRKKSHSKNSVRMN